MVTIPRWFVRYGFPALALAAVTMVVLLHGRRSMEVKRRGRR